MVRCFLGRVHGRRRVRQVRDHEQGRGGRGVERAASALLQQQRATRLQRGIPGPRLAVYEEVWVIILLRRLVEFLNVILLLNHGNDVR